MRSDVVVVGAGVIGLSAAVRLAESGLTVSIVTDRASRQTTSAAAGAMLAISGTPSGDPVTTWTEQSTPVFEALADDPDSGIHRVHGRAVTTFTDQIPAWAVDLPDFRSCTADELAGFRGGMAVTLPFADMPRYLTHLHARLSAAGVQVEYRHLRSLTELNGTCRIIVNCTGCGARELADDAELTPLRGVHVVVDNPGIDEFYMEAVADPEWTNIFPHPDRILVGGVAIPDGEGAASDEATAAAILTRAIRVSPRLAEARVRGYEVGWRPARPTPRVELDTAGETLCVHAYGHGGIGVTVSWGVADEVRRLVEAALGAGGRR